MSRIRRMNGRPLVYISYQDFGDPSRCSRLGGHMSEATAVSSLRRLKNCVNGWVWIERIDKNTGKLEECIEVDLKPYRKWIQARDRCRDHGDPALWEVVTREDLPCCFPHAPGHRLTARHFRYWCLRRSERATVFFPWIRPLLAEEILSGSDGGAI